MEAELLFYGLGFSVREMKRIGELHGILSHWCKLVVSNEGYVALQMHAA